MKKVNIFSTTLTRKYDILYQKVDFTINITFGGNRKT